MKVNPACGPNMLDFTTSDCHVEHPRKHSGFVAHKIANRI